MNQSDNVKKVFLLGGHDLEMRTIKRILEDNGFLVKDKALNWSNAGLSAYKEDLKNYLPGDYRIYGIELQEDGFDTLPENYVRIDHHNDFQDRPSALEQVAEVIGYDLTEADFLIAANDYGYYPAMEKFLKTRHPDMSNEEMRREMDKIRKEDRNAQGVTSEEELEAYEVKRENRFERVGDLKIVKVSDETTHFSAICDYLYPYDRLVVYREFMPELCYYGKEARRVHSELCSKFFASEDSGKYTYCGGGQNGFWGIKINSVSKEVLCDIIAWVKNMDSSYNEVTSSHLFYFPFVWKCRYSSDDKPCNDVIRDYMECKCRKSWINAADCNDIVNPEDGCLNEDFQDLYNELNYFFPFVHKEQYQYSDSLYTLLSKDLFSNGEKEIWEKNPRIIHFERVEKDLKYEIVVRIDDYVRRKYILDIYAINLNLYSTGVGLLAIFTRNSSDLCEEYDIRDYKIKSEPLDPLDILKINQYGRRVMPPFYKDIFNRGEIAESIAIRGLEDNANGRKYDLYEDFSSNSLEPQTWKYSKIISGLLMDFDPNLQYEMAIDDRMFVLTWYKNDKCIKEAREEIEDCLEDRPYYINHQSLKDYWYRFLFVDGGKDATCQDRHMKKQLLLEHTYTRWSGYNSLYGVTRYSMVYLTDSLVPDFLLKYFETIYARMAELVLMQRATVLKFSERINRINNIDSNRDSEREQIQNEVNKLCRDYIVFKNQFYFKEVTAQDQGIEMYDMLQKSLRLEEMVKDLDEDIQELYQYNSILEERENNISASRLNVILGAFTPAAFVLSLLAFDHWISGVGHLNKIWILLLTFIFGLILLWAVGKIYTLFKKIRLRFEVKNKIWKN